MYYFTKKGLKQLKENFNALKVDYKEKMIMLNSDKESNLSESGSFLFTRNQLIDRFKYEEKVFLDKLDNAVIIENTPEYKNWDGDTVIRMCRVLVNFDGDLETYTILGCEEADLDNNVITCQSDLALALYGHKVNDEIIFRGSKVVILDINPVEKVKKLTLENK